MAEAEFLHDGVGAFPKQEARLDGLAVLVIANPTLTLVAKQGSRGGFVEAPSAEDGGEVHVRSPWALKNRPTHVNLVVIGCQHIKVCRSGHGCKSKRANSEFQNGSELTRAIPHRGSAGEKFDAGGSQTRPYQEAARERAAEDPGCRQAGESKLAGGAGVAEEDDVGIEAAAEDGQGFAVRGPGEAAAALFGSELGDVVAGAAVDWLEPDVVDAIFADGVGERFAVRREMDATGDVRVGRNQLARALGSRIKTDERDFFLARGSRGKSSPARLR